MAKTREAKVRDPVVRYAHSLKIRTIRMYFGPGVQTAWPDDLFLIPGGVPLFLEAKAPGEKPSKKQDLKIKYLRDDGYNVNWYDSVEEGKKLVDAALWEAHVAGRLGEDWQSVRNK